MLQQPPGPGPGPGPGPHDTPTRAAHQPPPASHTRHTARFALFARLVLGDALALLIGFSAGSHVRDDAWLRPQGVNLLVVILPIFLMLSTNARAYSARVLSDYAESARRSISALVLTFLVTFMLIFASSEAEKISRLAMAVTFFVTLAAMLLFRFMADSWIKRDLDRELYDELLIVDGVPVPETHSRFVIDARDNQLEPDLDDPAMLERLARATDFYDRVLVACPPERQKVWATLLKTVDAKGELLVGKRDDIGAVGIGTYGDMNTLIVSLGALDIGDRIQKRLFDLALAIPALIVLSPLFLIVAILIKLDSRGPVFFKQPRVGRNNVPFLIWKFRSMRQEKSDLAGTQSTRRDDDRISRFGRFIRRTSIDELPQLFNVVKGDMSLVGPRPHALGSTADDQLFWQITHRYWERHTLKPGITGLAQIRGYRGATESISDLTNRLNSDLEYLSEWRLWKDVAIIFATLRVLVHPNAY